MNKKVIHLDGSNEEVLKRLDEKIEKMNVTEEEWKRIDEELFGEDEAEESGHTNFRDCGKE